jgi:beta-lactamase superfamily II metal-dependent hydrolase
MADTTVSVRMYNVGFGDAFVVTVRRDEEHWKMLVDCGVHSQGRARPIEEAVQAIVADLKADSVDGVPHLDVVVATHHHADHISGFAFDLWEQVVVDEVWVPFVEDEDDPDGKRLRESQTTTAQRIKELVERRQAVESGPAARLLAVAHDFAMNSFGNAESTDRLLSRNGLGFATKPAIRYLPSTVPAENVIETTISGVVARVLGPSRDPEQLKRMDPPKSAGWLRLDGDLDAEDEALPALFNDSFVARSTDALPVELTKAQKALHLDDITNDDGVLAAASVLERAVNNTSVFFVLDVAGTKLLFPGDAQQGAWEHVLNDPVSLALVKDVAFYKIGHHGSHNATPKRYVEEILHDGAYAMLPWGLVKRWADTIPKKELMDALTAHHHHVTLANAPVAEEGHVVVHEDLWSEVTFTVPEAPARARPGLSRD